MRDAIQPFPIHVPQADLDDLADRLARTRWPDDGTVRDGSQGPQPERIRALAERWQNGYDWRVTEALLNGWGGSRTVIDGLGIHFLHVRSPEPDATPLLLTHGWPGSVLEFRDVIGPLSNPRAHGGGRRTHSTSSFPRCPASASPTSRPSLAGASAGPLRRGAR